MLTIGDAQSIYIGCLLQVDGEYVYVIDISDTGVQTLLHVTSGDTFLRKQVDFDGYKPINDRLGYVNFAGQAVYITRTTVRQYKVGLTARNISIGEGLIRDRLWETAVRELQGMKAKQYVDTFQGRFPTLKDALKQLTNGATAVAFDRQFCVGNNMRVAYKDEYVGKVKDGQIIWNNGREHLELAISKGQYK